MTSGLPRYPANDNGTLQERLRPDFGIGWQYSSKATIPGISTKVDRNVFYKDYAETKAEPKKEETTVATKTKLQEFNDLGDFYAGEGTGKPYLKKLHLHIWMTSSVIQDITTTQSLPVMSTAGASRDVRDSHGAQYISSGNW